MFRSTSKLLLVLCLIPLASFAQATQPTGLDIQVQLDRAGFSPGIIDGKPGMNTKKALSAFQEAHDLPVTGNLDAETWESLAAAGSGPTLTEYEITPEDANGPFVAQIPEDMVEKAKLPALGYTSILEMLGERFHATPDFLKQLNPQTRFAAGERIRVPNARGPVAAESGDVRVVVSKSNGTLTVDRGGDVLFFAPVTSGSEHDPLPIGDWKVNGVAKNPSFNYNPDLFWDADPGHTKAKIPAGPNNPVGVVWIDINKAHYGLHGTPEPRTIGRSESHGCVRLTNWDALTLAGLVKPGTPVLFRP
ncbi:MAG: L,D-transpeptidase [Acidobacteriota bacterium]